MKRKYIDGSRPEVRVDYCRNSLGPPLCDHCDGEHSSMVRYDELRGWVCKDCDSALDEMFDEAPK